ncbi:MinD/ParA family ATP-binding protein [Gordonia sp. NPDC003429]
MPDDQSNQPLPSWIPAPEPESQPVAVPPVQAGPPAGYGPPVAPRTAPPMAPPMPPGPRPVSSLDEVPLLRRAQHAPASGWRRMLYKASGGKINPGDSPDDLHYAELVRWVNQPIRGDYRIAVLSLKGGVGKTTTAVGLGATLASLRGDRVIAVDANPDLGTLAQRVPQQTSSTVRDLIADENVTRYSDVRAHTSQAPNRLEVLASERDPATAEAFSEDDYRKVMEILRRHYNIIITDCGTGLSHSAMNGVLDHADMLILVTSPAIDGARSAAATLDWLHAHGYGALAAQSVVVIGSSRAGSSTIDLDQLSQHFLTKSRAVQQIPFDDHLAEGAEVDLELLHKRTRRAFVELAAVVAGDFPNTAHREQRAGQPG